ncbi:MAG: sulfatase-like hydrolase/transferase [Planctomycetes bacterium]|nr:sulfatase-like hydrolase/transferase [Planctomycetota bacterium]
MRLRELVPVVALALSLGACGNSRQAGPRRPNIVFVVIDTLRADHADSERGKARTPAIDALARDGVAFPNAFAHTPTTLPSHTTTFSSRLPFETGVRTNGQPVPKDLPLLAGWLEKNGYATEAAVSLASMWPTTDGRGLDRGFKRYDKGRWSVTRGDDLNHTLDTALDELPEEQPFFLFAHYSDPHEPYDAHGATERFAAFHLDGRDFGGACTSETSQTRREFILPPGVHQLTIASPAAFEVRSLEFTAPDVDVSWTFASGTLHEPIKGATVNITNPAPGNVTCTASIWLHDALPNDEVPLRYRGEVEYADRCLGELLGGLKRRGLYDSSIIVVTSDHGEGLGEHATWGHIVHLYDELLHVPLVIKLPSTLPGREGLEGAKLDLVRLIDVAPTLLDLVDLPPLEGQRGTSLLKSGVDRLLVGQTQLTDGSGELFCVRDKHFKMIYAPATDHWEMYDLEKDPLELGDVFATAGRERNDWRDMLRALAARTRRDGERQIDPETRARLDALGY